MKSLMIGAALIAATFADGHRASAAPEEMTIAIVRQETRDGLVLGTIGVDGAGIGAAFENDDLKIPAGTYEGVLRYWSGRGFAQGPFGSLGHEGDFLLEVADVHDDDGPRTNILFHAGDKPHHSKGCILLGPVARDPSGAANLDEHHPLRELRRRFYGTDHPTATPNKHITIVIEDLDEGDE